MKLSKERLHLNGWKQWSLILGVITAILVLLTQFDILGGVFPGRAEYDADKKEQAARDKGQNGQIAERATREELLRANETWSDKIGKIETTMKEQTDAINNLNTTTTSINTELRYLREERAGRTPE